MGQRWSRGPSVPPPPVPSDHPAPLYRFPPRAGRTFFGAHFIMGGEKFNRSSGNTQHGGHHDNFLFGDNADLNLLGSQPTHFPYPAPHPHEPTRMLRALVNVRKDSVALLAHSEGKCRLVFVLDADVRCWVRLHFFCIVRDSSQGPRIDSSREELQCAASFDYEPGAAQSFDQVLNLDLRHCQDELDSFANVHNETEGPHRAALVIHVGCKEGQQSMLTFARIEASGAHPVGFVVKPTKQKLYVDGLGYLLQEIYGLENKHIVHSRSRGDDDDDNSVDSDSSDDSEDIEESHNLECVVCMSQNRDTLILPCRHLCLCHHCADTLRYQASNCPICRAPFHALLQIRTVVRKTSKSDASVSSDEEEGEGLLLETNEDTFFPPTGYKSISLAESLNGRKVSRVPRPQARHKRRQRSSDVEQQASIEIIDEAISEGVESESNPKCQHKVSDCGPVERSRKSENLISKPQDLSLSSPNVSIFIPDDSHLSSAQEDEEVSRGIEGRHVRIYSLPGTPVSPSTSGIRTSRRGQSIIVHVSPPLEQSGDGLFNEAQV